MSSFKREEPAVVTKYEPQGVEEIKATSVENYIRASRESTGTGKGEFVIDSRISDYIGLTDLKKNDDKKIFDGEVLRYVQKIKDGAFEEAYAKGLLEGETKAKDEAFGAIKESLQQDLNSLKALLEKVTLINEKSYVDQEEEIITFCYLMAEKIVMTSLEKNPDMIKESIKKILQVNESQKDKVVVKLSKANFDFIQSSAPKAGSDIDFSKIKVEADANLKAGDIIIETPQGVVDATLNTRFEKLKAILEN